MSVVGNPITLGGGGGSGVNYWDTVINIDNLYYNKSTTDKPTPPKKIVLDLPSCVSVVGAFSQYIGSSAYNIGIEEVEITLYNPVSVNGFTKRNTSIKKIVFPNGLKIMPNASVYDFLPGGNSVLESVIGELDFSNAYEYNANDAFKCATLKDITFKQNCLDKSYTFTSTVLTDASVLSICNGLNEAVTGKTLTMPADVKTRMDAMLGTVAIDSTETYHIFTQDAQGTVTLTDFVTNTKGWTLA